MQGLTPNKRWVLITSNWAHSGTDDGRVRLDYRPPLSESEGQSPEYGELFEDPADCSQWVIASHQLRDLIPQTPSPTPTSFQTLFTARRRRRKESTLLKPLALSSSHFSRTSLLLQIHPQPVFHSGSFLPLLPGKEKEPEGRP